MRLFLLAPLGRLLPLDQGLRGWALVKRQEEMMTEYLDATETAKYVRRILTERWPSTKFSVRTDKYSMGASVRVKWTDGPRSKEVEQATGFLEGSGFDGMIDLKYSHHHYRLPDGTIIYGGTSGTEGSMGTCPAQERPIPFGAVEVHLMADFVNCSREVTDFDGKCDTAITMIRLRCQCDGEPPNDMFGNSWVADLARGMAWDQGEGEPLENTFRRVVLREV